MKVLLAEPVDLARQRKIYLAVLSFLLTLFCFRVAAQLIQHFTLLPFLPPFDAWHSGALPYWVLFASQLLVLGIYVWLLRRVAKPLHLPSRRQGKIFLVIGGIYFLAMAARFMVGITGLSERHWFHSYLPTLFHFVLAGFLILLGSFHLNNATRNP